VRQNPEVFYRVRKGIDETPNRHDIAQPLNLLGLDEAVGEANSWQAERG